MKQALSEENLCNFQLVHSFFSGGFLENSRQDKPARPSFLKKRTIIVRKKAKTGALLSIGPTGRFFSFGSLTRPAAEFLTWHGLCEPTSAGALACGFRSPESGRLRG